MAGRPTKYKAEFAELAMNYCLLGATDPEIAGFLGVGLRTVMDWKKAHPDFAEAMNHGKAHADAKMIGAAYRSGLAGNATIQIFWLKNRLGWRDRVDHAIGGIDGKPIDLNLTVEFVKPKDPKPKDQA
jgi:hypothetical protein